MSNHPLSYRRIDYLLLTLVIVLKAHLLLSRWGIPQGFDIEHFLTVIDTIRMSDSYPGVRDCYACYTPPFSFLLAMAMQKVTGNIITAVQVLSTLSMIGVILALRQTLKHIGLLHTLPGIVFLYVGAGIPLYVFLSLEITYETVTFLWAALTLLLSIELLWGPVQKRRALLLASGLTLVLALGMFTRYSGVINFCIPFIVLLTRTRPQRSYRLYALVLLSCIVAALVAAPLYYQRNMKPEGKLFFSGMDFSGGEEVMQRMYKLREERDDHPVLFILHILRLPNLDFSWPQYDSFFHVSWYQTWKHPGQPRVKTTSPPLVQALSYVYIFLFFVPLGIGTILFLYHFNKRQTPVLDFGMILFIIAILFCAAQVYFAFRYPAWQWAVMKAKYISPAILWVPFTLAYCLHLLDDQLQHSRWRSIFVACCSVFVAAFLCANHFFPVY